MTLEPYSIYFAISSIIIGMCIGIIMVKKYVLKKLVIPRVLTVSHGVFVATGVTLLIIYNLNSYSFGYWLASGFFILTALGGLTVLTIDLLGKQIPKILIFGHAGLASFSLIILLYFTFINPNT